jgi:hypothetical protein
VAVRAEQRLARFTEVFLVARVTHPVSRSRVPHATALAGAAQKKMIVGGFEVFLNDVVVNVLDAHLSLHPV